MVPRLPCVTTTLLAGPSWASEPSEVVTFTLSTTSVNVQVSLLASSTHTTANAVPSTAAVVPPAFTSNDPVSETLAARFQVSPTESVPWVWRPPCLFVSLVILNSVELPSRVSEPSV